jgi:hypothetical protein
MARMTYVGSCVIGGNVILPCTSLSSGIESSIGIMDHTIGLRDTNFTGTNQKGPATNDSDQVGGYNQIGKKIFRYMPSVVKGKMSGPLSVTDTSLNIGELIENAIKGTEISQIDFIYFGSPDGSATKEGHQVKLAVVESLTLSVAAGDVATFDLSVISKKNEGPPTAYKKSDCSKLLTWDQCEITSALVGGSDEVQNFSITIKNTVIPIYVSGAESEYSGTNYFGPTALRLGVQEVTGTIGTYGFNNWNTTADTLKFKFGQNTHQIHVLYSPSQSSGSGSNEPYVSSTPFTAVSNQPVWVVQS